MFLATFFPHYGAAAPFANVTFLFTSWSPKPQHKYNIHPLIETIHRTPTIRYSICSNTHTAFSGFKVDHQAQIVIDDLRLSARHLSSQGICELHLSHDSLSPAYSSRLCI